jgi:hypothetical protein
MPTVCSAPGVTAFTSAGGFAVNAATADPPHWPGWLAWIPLPPVPSAVVLLVLSAAVTLLAPAVTAPHRGWARVVTASLTGGLSLVGGLASLAGNSAKQPGDTTPPEPASERRVTSLRSKGFLMRH